MDCPVCGMERHSKERRMHREVMEAIMEAEEREHSGGTREGTDTTAALQVLVRGAGKVGCR